MPSEDDLTTLDHQLWADRCDQTVLPTGPLWHYTNAAGFVGIVTSKRLWASNVDYMNDTSETSYGLSLCDEALKRLDPSGAIFDGLRSRAGRHRMQAFCLSLSEHDDELSQWRGYGSNNGYSLGIKIPLENFARDFRAIYRIGAVGSIDPVLIKIDYLFATQKSLVERTFSSLVNFYRRMLPQQTAPFYKVLFRHYTDLSLRLKNPKFSSEAEWRIVWLSNDGFPPAHSSKHSDVVTGESKFTAPTVLYRPSGEGFMPYIAYARLADWLNPDAPYHLASVVQGPRSYADIQLSSLKGFLKQTHLQYDVSSLRNNHRFDEIIVKRSELPLRL